MPGTNKLHRKKNACGFPKVEQKETQCILSVSNGYVQTSFMSFYQATITRIGKCLAMGRCLAFGETQHLNSFTMILGILLHAWGRGQSYFLFQKLARVVRILLKESEGFRKRSWSSSGVQGGVHEPDWTSLWSMMQPLLPGGHGQRHPLQVCNVISDIVPEKP